MVADGPTRFATDSLNGLKDALQLDNKVKVAGCVIICLHRPILTDPVTQVSTVGHRPHFLSQRLIVSSGWGFARKIHGAFVDGPPLSTCLHGQPSSPCSRRTSS